jgi:DNA-binding PadR family transcriptional regulator
MSLAYAILATLTFQECSGYDLAKRFDESVGYFWSATHQQIYRELGQLEAKGWICSHTVEQTDRPNKKMFELTPLGHQKMAEWMARPSRHSKHKEEILVKLFAGSLIDPALLKAELLRSQADHQHQLQTYQGIERQYFPEPAQLSFPEKCQYLTLRQGISHEANWIEWCSEALSLLSLEPRDDDGERDSEPLNSSAAAKCKSTLSLDP